MVGVTVRAARGPVHIDALHPDGQRIFVGILPPGESRTFVEPALSLLVGDAGAADRFVDGEARPRPGEPGQVVRVTVRS